MAAVAQPTSHVMACDIVPGNAADDPLYLPLIRRVRQQLGPVKNDLARVLSLTADYAIRNRLAITTLFLRL